MAFETAKNHLETLKNAVLRSKVGAGTALGGRLDAGRRVRAQNFTEKY